MMNTGWPVVAALVGFGVALFLVLQERARSKRAPLQAPKRQRLLEYAGMRQTWQRGTRTVVITTATIDRLNQMGKEFDALWATD